MEFYKFQVQLTFVTSPTIVNHDFPNHKYFTTIVKFVDIFKWSRETSSNQNTTTKKNHTATWLPYRSGWLTFFFFFFLTYVA